MAIHNTLEQINTEKIFNIKRSLLKFTNIGILQFVAFYRNEQAEDEDGYCISRYLSTPLA